MSVYDNHLAHLMPHTVVSLPHTVVSPLKEKPVKSLRIVAFCLIAANAVMLVANAISMSNLNDASRKVQVAISNNQFLMNEIARMPSRVVYQQAPLSIDNQTSGTIACPAAYVSYNGGCQQLVPFSATNIVYSSNGASSITLGTIAMDGMTISQGIAHDANCIPIRQREDAIAQGAPTSPTVLQLQRAIVNAISDTTDIPQGERGIGVVVTDYGNVVGVPQSVPLPQPRPEIEQVANR